MASFSTLGVLILAGSLFTGDEPNLTDRLKTETDAFIFCTLDNSMEQLKSPKTAEAVAETSVDKCSAELKALEAAIAATYREVNAGVWPQGMAEEEASKSRVQYRQLAVEAAMKIINERRSTQPHP